MYRPSSRRAVSALAAMALAPVLLVAGAAPARANVSGTCPEATSTRLVTVNDGAGSPVERLWVYQPAPQEVRICFVQSGVVAGALWFGTGLSGSLVPTVTPVVDDTACPVFLHVQDPVDFVARLAATSSSPYYVCFGFGSTAFGVAVTAASGSADPVAQLWIDRHTVAGDVWCAYVAPGAYECGGSAIRVL